MHGNIKIYARRYQVFCMETSRLIQGNRKASMWASMNIMKVEEPSKLQTCLQSQSKEKSCENA